MKNHESDPQNHGTGLQYDDSCIFLFLTEKLLPCDLVCTMSEAPLSVCGVWVQLSALSSPVSSPSCAAGPGKENGTDPECSGRRRKDVVAAQHSASPSEPSLGPCPS